MAKLKSKINSKYKAAPKRKLVLGGLEDSPYLAKTNYQAQDAPTTMLQNQFDAQEQDKAKRMTTIYGNQVARELDYLQDANAASEKRKQDEAKAAKEKQEAEKQKAMSTVGTGAAKIGKDLVKSAIAPTTVSAAGYTSPVWTSTAPAITAQSAGYAAPTLVNPAMQATTSTVGELLPNAVPVGQNAATMTTTGTNAATVANTAGTMSGIAAAGTSLGLVAAGEGVGYWATASQKKKDDAAKRSQYYRDTNYTNREALGQIGKSTLKGAGYGVSLGHAVPGIGEAVGAAIGTQAGLMVGTGIAAKNLYDTKGVKVFGKQYGAKNKYDENLDPTVLEKRNSAAQLQAMTNTANAMENARMTSMTQSDLNTGFALKNSTFEAKYGGSIKKLKGGVAKSIGRGAVEYVGKKHEHGGIDLPGNIEVEDGETEQNDYVFSATLKLPNGATYAQTHKNLIKSGASGEEIHQLALSQEAAAGRNPNQIKGMKFAKYGGPLQYDKGGKKEPDIVVGGRSKEYWQNLSAFCAKNPRHYSCLSGDNGTTGNEARKVNGVNQGIALEMLDESGNPVNTYEDYLKAIENSKRTDFAGGKSYSASVPNYYIVKDGKYTEEELENMPLDKYMEIATPYIDKRKYNIDYINGDAYYKGLLPNLSKEEFEYYKGLRDNPNTTIPNPANGTTLPNEEGLNSNTPYAGTAVEFNTTSPAGEYSEQAAKDAPKTKKGKEVFNKLQNSLKERAAKRAEANKVYNSNELPEATVTGSKPQQSEVRETEAPSPSIKGKDAMKFERTQPQLAQYNLPTTKSYNSTFVPDEEPTAQNQVTAAIANSGLSTEEFAKQTGVDPEVIKGIQAGTVNLNPDEQAMLMAAIPNTPIVTTNTNPPVTTQTNNPPVTNTNTNMPNPDNNQPKANPTYNTYNMPYQYTATNKGKLDYSDPNVAGGIWAGDKYNTEWKPLVSGTMSDAGKADKVISYLENYNGQDAADVKAKIAGKTREEKIAIINRLATDNKVGPFHNAVLEGINTTKETPPPPEPVVEKKKDEETPPSVKKDYTMELPPPPTYTRTKSTNGLGLIQAIPAAAALTNNIKTQDINPALTSSYVQPGAIGRVNVGLISYNAERAANQANQAAMNQALQNMSGPGAVAGMLAAKTKADQQALQIGQAEQNTNVERAAREAGINTGISQFNVGQAMAAQQAKANIDQANAGRMQQANQFNTQVRYARDVENREQRLGALDRGAQAITMNALANRQIDATENLASVQDYTNAYKRYLETIAPTLGVNTTTTEDKTKTTAKFGGVKKYVSRLGDLKNNRTFKA
jgi:hypothetical protein